MYLRTDSQREIPGICNEKHFKLSQNLRKIFHMQKVGLINFKHRLRNTKKKVSNDTLNSTNKYIPYPGLINKYIFICDGSLNNFNINDFLMQV